MPDLASLTSATSLLSGVVPTAPAIGGNADQGGFQAVLAEKVADLAGNPVVAALLPPVGMLAGLLPGLAQTATQSGNGNLPEGGKILPVDPAVTDAATDATVDGQDTPAADTAADTAEATDPALMLMLNGAMQPAPQTQPAPVTPAAAAPATQQAIAQRAGTTPAAQLAVSAQTTTSEPAAQNDNAPQTDTTLAAAQTVTLRPVAQPPAGQNAPDGEANGQNAERHTAFTDPQALAASEDASQAALPPTPGLAEASAGAVQTSPATVQTDAPANSITPANSAARNDMATLVDRLVEARQAARMAGPQSVTASIQHGDFGRVSLDFRQDNTGLSVGMTSADPAFAPAAQAALAQQQQVNATNTGNSAGDSTGNNPSGNQNWEQSWGQSAGQNTGQSAGQNTGNQSGTDQRPFTGWASEADIPARPAPPATPTNGNTRGNSILA